MSEILMVAPCLMGLEGLVSNELKRMDAESVLAENGRVFFSGNENILARANINSRYSERIAIVLSRFDAFSFDELFERTKALDWTRWIDKTDAFPVKGSSINSKLHSIPDCQKIIKKAVVENLKQKYKVNWLEESGVKKQIAFLIYKDNVCLMIETSGEGLHKRGYRKEGASAPIKETLAAAISDISFVRRDSFVIDPCCGSGTLLIESALKAMNIAPGIQRSFASEKFKQIDTSVWREERTRALDLVNKNSKFQAVGYDIDPNTLSIAKSNAVKAGVADRIDFSVRDIRDFKHERDNAVVLCNPPYGERLLDTREASELYRAMGRAFFRKEGWTYSIISPDEQFEKFFGRKADKRRKMYNGMIKCQLYTYFK